jgi:hypothetical protein
MMPFRFNGRRPELLLFLCQQWFTLRKADPQLSLFGPKHEPVQHPGSRGGKGYYSEKGRWVYGERSEAPAVPKTPGVMADEELARYPTTRTEQCPHCDYHAYSAVHPAYHETRYGVYAHGGTLGERGQFITKKLYGPRDRHLTRRLAHAAMHRHFARAHPETCATPVPPPAEPPPTPAPPVPTSVTKPAGEHRGRRLIVGTGKLQAGKYAVVDETGHMVGGWAATPDAAVDEAERVEKRAAEGARLRALEVEAWQHIRGGSLSSEHWRATGTPRILSRRQAIGLVRQLRPDLRNDKQAAALIHPGYERMTREGSSLYNRDVIAEHALARAREPAS